MKLNSLTPLVLLWRAALAVCLLLAACTPAPTTNLAQSAGTVQRDQVTVAVPRGAESRAMQAAAAAYQQGGGAPLRVVVLDSDVYYDQVTAVLLGGLDRYDLVSVSADSLAKWVGYHALRPFSRPDAADKAVAPWLPAVTVAGKPYGLPTQPDPLVLWYRADWLAAKNLPVPGDWPAVRQAAIAMNAPPEHYGAVIAGADLDAGAEFNAILAGFGGQPIQGSESAGYSVALNGEAALRALTLYADLRLTDKVVPPGADRYGRGDVLQALREGKAGLGLAPLSAGASLRDCQANPKVCQAGKPLLDWAGLPGLAETSAMGDLSAWVMPIHAAHADEAQRFAAWLMGAEGARILAQNGRIPAHTGVLAEPASQKITGAAYLARLTDYRLAFPQTRSVDGLWKAVHIAAHAAVSGEKSPAQALAAAAEAMRQALRQAGEAATSPQ